MKSMFQLPLVSQLSTQSKSAHCSPVCTP